MALPSAPTACCVYSSLNALSLRINWTSVDAISSYSLYVSPVPHDGFTAVASGLTGLTYFDNRQSDEETLNLRNQYYYRVSSTNYQGEGEKSGPATFMPYHHFIDANVPRPGLSFWSLIF